MSDAPSVPPIQRQRKPRDLARAEWLRPRDIYELTGITQASICHLCKADGERNLPSVMIAGRGGKKGIRLVRRVDLEAYLQKFQTP